VRDSLSPEDTAEALAIIDALGVTFDLAPDNVRAIEIAVELERHSAYDAAYLALGERLGAEVWTLDGPLARNAGGRHPVKLID
jgi:predicted nucleic acid-binding protein